MSDNEALVSKLRALSAIDVPSLVPRERLGELNADVVASTFDAMKRLLDQVQQLDLEALEEARIRSVLTALGNVEEVLALAEAFAAQESEAEPLSPQALVTEVRSRYRDLFDALTPELTHGLSASVRALGDDASDDLRAWNELLLTEVAELRAEVESLRRAVDAGRIQTSLRVAHRREDSASTYYLVMSMVWFLAVVVFGGATLWYALIHVGGLRYPHPSPELEEILATVAPRLIVVTVLVATTFVSARNLRSLWQVSRAKR